MLLSVRKVLEIDNLWPVAPDDSCDVLDTKFMNEYEPLKAEEQQQSETTDEKLLDFALVIDDRKWLADRPPLDRRTRSFARASLLLCLLLVTSCHFGFFATHRS